MKRPLALALLALLVAAPSIARADDTSFSVVFGGRPLAAGDSDVGPPAAGTGVSAISHDGVIFINIVRFTRAINGFLLFGRGDNTVTVNAHQHAVTFTLGKASALFDGTEATIGAAPFVSDGDIFVPVDSIEHYRGAKASVDTQTRVVRIVPSAQNAPQ